MSSRALYSIIAGVAGATAGIAGVVVVASNTATGSKNVGGAVPGAPGLSRGTYELLTVGSYFVLLLGLTALALGLIAHARTGGH